MQGVPAQMQKANIEQRANQAKTDVRAALASLINGVAAAEKLDSVSKQVISMEFPHEVRPLEVAANVVAYAYGACSGLSNGVSSDILRQLQLSEEVDYAVLRSSARLLLGADAQFHKLHAAFAGDEEGFVGVLHGQLASVETAIQSAKTEEARLTEQKVQLSKGLSDASPRIYLALSELREALPTASPQLLCDLIEPRPGDWQRPIEAYMGDARFNVVVTPESEVMAIEFCRAKRLPLHIVQGALCLERSANKNLHQDSIVHELTTAHPIAMAYLVEQYGGVVKVASEHLLKRTARGVTLLGSASGSRKMYSLNDFQSIKLVFGKEAKRLAFERVQEEYEKIESSLRKRQTLQQELRGLLGLAAGVSLPVFDQAEALERAAIAMENCEEELSRLDLSELDDMNTADEKLAAKLTKLQSQLEEGSVRKGEYKKSIEQRLGEITQVQALRDKKKTKVDAEISRLRNFCLANPALSMPAMEEQIGAWVVADTWNTSALNSRILDLSTKAVDAASSVNMIIADYNGLAEGDERLDAGAAMARDALMLESYSHHLLLRTKVQQQVSMQQGIGIVKNLKEVQDAEETFTDVFTGQFCMSVREAVDDGIKSLKALNNELERLKFGTDRFTIDWSEWVPEFKEYYDFFVAAAQMSANEGSSLFANEGLTEAQIKVRDRLRDILLQQDIEASKKEVLRIADYRNYRRYEIWKVSDIGSKIALSEWGTGSGGQLETPAYIIRAAVVTNRLKHFEKGMNLKFIINDESFSKMDERRSLDVLKFLRDSLGMQFVCAMPSRGAGPLKPEFTREWNFSRVESTGAGEVSYITEADERELRPDKLQELWETHRRNKRTQAQIAFEEQEAQSQ